MVDTNVTAVAILTKLFAAGMVERNRGHIINISSVAAHHAYPGTFSVSVLEPKSCNILNNNITISSDGCLDCEAEVQRHPEASTKVGKQASAEKPDTV